MIPNSAMFSHQFEVDLDHLLQGLESPLSLLVILQVQHLLERLQGIVRGLLLERLTVVVLVLQVHIRLGVAVLGIFLKKKTQISAQIKKT